MAAYLLERHHTVGVIVVVTHAESRKMLLVEQALRQRGKWGLPGGFVKRGEQPEVTAHRELLEEAGIEIHAFEHVDAYRQPWARHYDLVLAAETDDLGSPSLNQSSEVRRAAWFDISRPPAQLTQETQYLLGRLQARNAL